MKPLTLSTQDKTLLDQLSNAPALDVVSDYDGVLAPFANDPQQAWPQPGIFTVLQQLALTTDTRVLVLTGRSRAEIIRFAQHDSDAFDNQLSFTTTDGQQANIYIIGDHGASLDPRLDTTKQTNPDHPTQVRQVALCQELKQALSEKFSSYRIVDKPIAGDTNVIRLEYKTYGIAVHTRSFDDQHRRDATAIRAFVAAFGPLHLQPVYRIGGSEVEELSVVERSKGRAINYLRNTRPVGKRAPIIFLGDDITDLAAFGELGATDIGLVVGSKIVQEIAKLKLRQGRNLIFIANPQQAFAALSFIATARASEAKNY